MAPTKPTKPKKAKKERKIPVNEDDVRAALAQRERDGTSFRTLAILHKVPSSTLADRARGGLSRKESHIHQQRLTPAMEKSLQDWCKQLDDWGFPPRMDLLHAMAEALVQQRAEEEEDPELAGLGKHWVSNFLGRHPDLASKFGTQLDRQRAYASNLASLRDYFRKLARLIRKHNLRPEDIFNMDEKGFIIGRSARAKVICRAGRRPPRVTQDGTREMLTVIECCCAAQYMTPSFVIYKGIAQYMGWHFETSDPDAMFACSPNGWTDDELGLEWLFHFDRCTENRKDGNGRTRLLILDGHRSHITLEFCQYAIEHNIELLCFPPHSTHLLQPLDVGLFSPLQKYYGKAADDHIRDTRTGVAKGTFWSFYSTARRQAYTKQSIKSAFRKTGIHPFNPDAVLTQIAGFTEPPTSQSHPPPQAAILAKLKTPRKSRDVRQQTQFAIEAVKLGDTENAIAAIRRFGHTTQTALSTAEIRGIELADIRRQYAGKKAATTDRRIITKARVIDGTTLIKMRNERVELDRLKAERTVNKRKGKAAAVPKTKVKSKPSEDTPPKIPIVPTATSSSSTASNSVLPSSLPSTSAPPTLVPTHVAEPKKAKKANKQKKLKVC